ncbi:MAG: molecular chaperone DnaJ [Candidatus Peribacteraceae bacterium]|nr:molecular chaperone DnaJ [Candidatus Peribacteraceae bacterium]MDD5075001.1 molecular chaperone DnaJ [Candidatus Peribacteraceae bacterium]
MPKDLYDILGLPRSASKEDIKKAYRKLSKELHPDRNKGKKDAEQKFKEVNEAYEVLHDDKKRQMYDQFGTTGGPGGATGNGGAGAGGPFGGFNFSGFQGGDMGGFSDLFETFFGGGQAGGGRRKSERGRDLEVEMTVELMEVVTGVTRSFELRRQRTCNACGGSGAEKGGKLVTCSECKGTGQVTKTSQSFFGTFKQAFVCPVCDGAGKIPEHPCKECKGEGHREERGTVTVNIPAGVQDGQTLRVKGEGEAGRRGAPAGELYVLIRVRPDRRFERDGDDVRTVIAVSVTDAILGAEVPVETVHGSVTLKVAAGTQPGQIFRLKGKGLPVLNSSRTGDHYVTVTVDIPAKLSHEEKKLLEEWRRIREM